MGGVDYMETMPVLGQDDRRLPALMLPELQLLLAVFDAPATANQVLELPLPVDLEGCRIEQKQLRQTGLRNLDNRPFGRAVDNQLGAILGILQQ